MGQAAHGKRPDEAAQSPGDARANVNDAGSTREVSASELKNAWHAYLDRVRQAREELVITWYGRPVAKLVPYTGDRGQPDIVGFLAGTVTVRGDIVAPTGEEWEADA